MCDQDILGEEAFAVTASLLWTPRCLNEACKLLFTDEKGWKEISALCSPA